MPYSTPRPPICPSRRRFLAKMGGLVVVTGLGLASPQLDARLNPLRLRQSMRRLYGESRLPILEEWFALLERLSLADIQTQLKESNAFFNRRVLWLDDIDIWGQEDYWATPLETLGRGKGDCEDYTIGKYVTLTQVGVPVRRLRLIYVKARIGRSRITQAHMVLGYYETPGAEPLILDNLVQTIQPASRRQDLEPVFSFNSDGLWVGSSEESRADPLARLSRWRNVIDRMREQGFI